MAAVIKIKDENGNWISVPIISNGDNEEYATKDYVDAQIGNIEQLLQEI